MALPNFQGARTPASLVTARATDYAAIINRARDPLIAAGVNPDFIDPGLALRRGYTDSIFAGLLRPFADAESIERIDLLFHVGITEGLFTMARSMTLEQFFGFLKFLRSPQGQESVNNAARKEKFAKRGGTARTSEEMGWIGMFEVVRTNCGNKVGDVRKEFELKIAEAELVLKDLRAESERAIVRTYDQFYPIGEYKALEVEVLNRRCWDRYCRENLVAGGEEPFLTQPNLKAAVESFADIVKGDHIVQFMQSDERRNAIKEQIYREIGVVEARHDGRSAKRFRLYLETVGDRTPGQTPPAPEAAARQQDPRGFPGPVQPRADFAEAIINPEERVVRDEEADRPQAPPVNQPPPRDLALELRRSGRQLPRPHTSTYARRGRPGHSTSSE
ncbi:TPA_asm: hypothetical protein [Epipogium roseum amalgavirus 1]|nr:TPA_asm: hypothetical protein [Epipogium roseum amalgavirus 1]